MARTLSRTRRQLAERLANFDPNASFSPQYFMQRLQQECDRSRRYGLPMTLLVLRFHPKSGAAGTQRMATSIAADVFTHVAMAMRREDVMGQLAELDYGIYLPHTAREGAAIVSQRLVDALQEYEPTVGVAVFDEDGFSGTALLMAALRNGEGSYNREEVHSAWNGTRVQDY
jgi:GGDEF domain-containing protein